MTNFILHEGSSERPLTDLGYANSKKTFLILIFEN